MTVIYNQNTLVPNGGYATSNGTITGIPTNYTVTYQSPPSNFHDGTDPVMVIPHGSKSVQIPKTATLDVIGTVKINGLDLEERLNTIETLLQIPQRDVTMESKYPKLAELYKQYMRELEKLKTWDALKESK